MPRFVEWVKKRKIPQGVWWWGLCIDPLPEQCWIQYKTEGIKTKGRGRGKEGIVGFIKKVENADNIKKGNGYVSHTDG